MNALSESSNLRFAELKQQTELSSGNLFSHCAVLEKHGYITKEQIIADDGKQVVYSITAAGISALTSYLSTLDDFISRLQFKLRGSYESMRFQLPPSIFLELSDPESHHFRIAEFD